MDPLHRALKVVDHNRWLAGGLTLTAVVFVWLFGCHSQTGSLLDPSKKVTRPELAREIAGYQASLELRRATWRSEGEAIDASARAFADQSEWAIDDLDQQDAAQAQVIEILGGLAGQAATGAWNPASAVGAGVSVISLLVGAGAIVDNRRKDKQLKRNGNGSGSGGG